MENTTFWTKIYYLLDTPKILWSPEEFTQDPSIVDRIIYYLISYFDQPSSAKRALRILVGIDSFRENMPEFCDWQEVRVTSLTQLEDVLKFSGCTSNTWELAVTIRDFLQNTWDTLETLDLNTAIDELKSNEINAYLKQLRGVGIWRKNETSPYRPFFSTFNKHCLKYRKNNEPVLPENVIHYLEYLWGKTTKSPYEFHANKVLSRLGILTDQDEINTKLNKFNSFIGNEKPINKHRQLVQFSKTICIMKPRCNICPLNQECNFSKMINSEDRSI